MSDELAKQKPDKPWLKIMDQPRKTIREILDYTPLYGVGYIMAALVVLATISVCLQNSATSSVILKVSMVTALIIIFSTSLEVLLATYVGKLLGGKAELKEVTAAMVWPLIIVVYFCILDIPSNLLSKRSLFDIPFLKDVGFYYVQIIKMVCLSEAHQLSSGKVLIIMLLILAVSLSLVFLGYKILFQF